MLVLVGCPGIFGNWALEGQRVTGLQVVYMCGHGSTGIDFDDEIEVAFGVWSRKRLLVGAS